LNRTAIAPHNVAMVTSNTEAIQRAPANDEAVQMRIGELARRSGRSVHTIRWYESKHLIPGAARDAGGQRVFNAHHVQWLELLHRLRTTGMSIRDMQSYARLIRQGKATLAECRDLLLQHRERLLLRTEELQQALSLMDTKIALYDRWIERDAARTAAPAPRRKSRA